MKKNFMAVVVTLVMFIVGCGQTLERQETTVVDKLIETAGNQSVSPDEADEVVLNEDSFSVDGREYFYMPIGFQEGEPISEIADEAISEKILSDFVEAKELVNEFIDESFRETSELKDFIDEAKLVLGDFSISEKMKNSSFVYEDGIIWLNPEINQNAEVFPDDLLVFTIVHELIHMLKDKTFSINETSYWSYKFDEAMTDVIAKSIYDYTRDDGHGYNRYYPFAYNFIDEFGKEAIWGYFEGYSQIEGLGSDELEIFVFLTEIYSDEIQADGMSDAEVYAMINGMETEADIITLARTIIHSSKGAA